MGRRLIEFAERNRLSETWESSPAKDISAFVTGRVLDNQNPAVAVIDRDLNDELLISLHSPQGDVVVNMNDILAMACAYIREQYRKAGESIKPRGVTFDHNPATGVTSVTT